MMSLALTFGSHQSHASVGLWAVTLTGCKAVLVIHIVAYGISKPSQPEIKVSRDITVV